VEKQQIYHILRGFFERGTRKAKKTAHSDVQKAKTAGRMGRRTASGSGLGFKLFRGEGEFHESSLFDPNVFEVSTLDCVLPQEQQPRTSLSETLPKNAY
jgi:hypothetical protein